MSERITEMQNRESGSAVRWHCGGCGHYQGRERCTALTTREDGARKWGCLGHGTGYRVDQRCDQEPILPLLPDRPGEGLGFAVLLLACHALPANVLGTIPNQGCLPRRGRVTMEAGMYPSGHFEQSGGPPMFFEDLGGPSLLKRYLQDGGYSGRLPKYGLVRDVCRFLDFPARDSVRAKPVSRIWNPSNTGEPRGSRYE